MKNNYEATQKKWAQVITKAWMDPKFKTKLLTSPEAVLKEYGLTEAQHSYKIIEAKKNELCFVLPPKPEGSLSEAELKNLAAAASASAPFGEPRL